MVWVNDAHEPSPAMGALNFVALKSVAIEVG